MKLKQIKKWEKTRKMGPWRYAFIYGTLWGILVPTYVYIMDYFLHFDDKPKDISYIIRNYVIFIFLGILLYRFFMWKYFERKYQAWKKKQQDS